MSTAPVTVKPRRSRKTVKKAQLNLFEPVDRPDQQQIYSAKTKRAKALDQYNRTRPAELKLFELLNPDDGPYSNTIELYDFIPKHYWGKVERINEEFLRPLEREFECRGTRYKVIIAPARLKDADGKFRDYYPGRREELVEAALRKLVCDGHGAFLDDCAGVIFSLTELQKELKSMGHTYSIVEIKEALFICVNIRITLSNANNETIIVSGIIETLGLRTWEDWLEKGQQTKCFVRFNPLVTESIKNGTFRKFNYERYMSCKHVITRQLYKRVSHHYTQASMANTYEIMLSTIIRDFGLTSQGRVKDKLNEVGLALKELVEKSVILEYKVEKIIDPKHRNKLTDAKITIRPHPRFSSETIKANETQRQIRTVLIPIKN